jgi:SNF2 family DNA or RNA helicase
MRQKSELRPYQHRIATALYESDEKIAVARPGGGKTIAALTAIEELFRDGHIRHALVIAPKRVARNVWPDEIAQWAHTKGLTYQVITGSPKQRVDMLSNAVEYNLTIIGIDVVQWLLDQLVEYPDEHPLFDLLVIDEISKLRNPSGVRARKLLRYAKRWKMVWGLTGTLRPSGAENLFMPATVVTRGGLWGKSFYRWRSERFYATDYQGYTWAPLPGAEEVINREIAPLCVTLRDDELPQLPELLILFDRVDLPADARKQYEDMEQELALEADTGDIVIAKSAAVATGKLAQLANGFVYNDGVTHRIHGEKEEWVEEIIDGADGPVLIVYEYREDLEMLRGLLGQDLPYLGAGVTNKASDQYITQWNEGKLPFMALHPASGGHGLNLQFGGCDMAWISPTWSPEMWEQTIARIYRSGQTKPVVVRVCLAHDTVDQMKVDRVHKKMTAQKAFEAYLRRHEVVRDSRQQVTA